MSGSIAAVTDVDGASHGHWTFSSTPRVGEKVMLAEERFEVVDVEHWPEIFPSGTLMRSGIQLRIFVKICEH